LAQEERKKNCTDLKTMSRPMLYLSNKSCERTADVS